MSDIPFWSPTAGNNGDAAPDGWPEGSMLIGQVNNAARENMAAIRRQWNDAEWFNYGDGDKSPSYSFVSSTVVKVVGGSGEIAEYHAGRRVKYVGAATIYGTIQSSSTNAADLDVTITWDSGNAINESFNLFLGILRTNNPALPEGLTYVGAQIPQTKLDLPRNYIAGLLTSNNVTDSDHDIDISVGECRDDANTENLVLSATLTKRIDASWSVGDGNGGLDTGVVAANTQYGVWLIKRTDTDVVDALFSTSFTAPTMPANYDKKRLVGWVVTDSSSNIIGFVHRGDYFYLNDEVVDVQDNVLTANVAKTGSFSVPPNSIALFSGRVEYSSAVNDARFHVRQSGSVETFTGNSNAVTGIVSNANDLTSAGGSGEVLVDGSSQFLYAAAEPLGTATLRIAIYGCNMLTRSNP